MPNSLSWFNLVRTLNDVGRTIKRWPGWAVLPEGHQKYAKAVEITGRLQKIWEGRRKYHNFIGLPPDEQALLYNYPSHYFIYSARCVVNRFRQLFLYSLLVGSGEKS